MQVLIKPRGEVTINQIIGVSGVKKFISFDSQGVLVEVEPLEGINDDLKDLCEKPEDVVILP